MSIWDFRRWERVTRKLWSRGLGLIIVCIVAWFVASLLFARSADDAKYHRLGSAYLGYDRRAECFLIRDERSRVLDSGLIDGRGIAIASEDPNPADQSAIDQVLYVADASQGVYALHISNAPSVTAPTELTAVCPEGFCEQADYGGLLVHPRYGLILSDAQRQQLLVRKSNGSFEPPVGGPLLRSVRDVTWVPEYHAFLAAIGDAPNETSPGDRGNGERTGEIAWISDPAMGSKPDPIKGLRRPVGVMWSARTNRLYVADVDGRYEVWSYYIRNESVWSKAGTLWRQDVGAFGPSIHLQDMVVADFDYGFEERENGSACVKDVSPQRESQPKEEVVVSAGPDGIYFFHSDGSLLAKYYIGRPVAGLTWGPADSGTESNWLYFTSGHQIAALKTKLKDPSQKIGPAAEHSVH